MRFSLRAIRWAATSCPPLFQCCLACARTLFKPVVLIRYGWPFTDLTGAFFGFEFFEDRAGAVAQQQPFAGVAFLTAVMRPGGNADVRTRPPWRERGGPLF